MNCSWRVFNSWLCCCRHAPEHRFWCSSAMPQMPQALECLMATGQVQEEVHLQVSSSLVKKRSLLFSPSWVQGVLASWVSLRLNINIAMPLISVHSSAHNLGQVNGVFVNAAFIFPKFECHDGGTFWIPSHTLPQQGQNQDKSTTSFVCLICN